MDSRLIGLHIKGDLYYLWEISSCGRVTLSKAIKALVSKHKKYIVNVCCLHLSLISDSHVSS